MQTVAAEHRQKAAKSMPGGLSLKRVSGAGMVPNDSSSGLQHLFGSVE
jgi:hypothetical protein